jgi:hypothetical protein
MPSKSHARAHKPNKRLPQRLAVIMTDGTIEPIEIEEEDVTIGDLMRQLPMAHPESVALVRAVEAALRRFK